MVSLEQTTQLVQEENLGLARPAREPDVLVRRTVFNIRPPDDDGSKYVLLVSRGNSLLGGGSHCAFAVDGTDVMIDPQGKAYAIRGMRNIPPKGNRELVVEFPIGVSYLLTRRSDVRMLTSLEAAAEQAVENKAIDAIFYDQETAEAGGGNKMTTMAPEDSKGYL